MAAGCKTSRKRGKGKLTAQQRLFAHEYLVDRNATQAAIRAGYSSRSAYSQGERLLRHAEVAKLVEAGMTRLTEKIDLKIDRIVLELHRILTADPLDALDDDGSLRALSEWPKDLRCALSGIDVQELFDGRGEDRMVIGFLKKVRFWSKPEAADQLMRHLGGYEKDHAQAAETLSSIIRAAREKKAKR